MSTLTEIEAAADTLPRTEKEMLFEFLAARLGRNVESAKSDGNRPLVFPLIQGTPGNIIHPTKEQLCDL